jgi:tetratricopeptide (TPR) repeat protein
MGIEKINFTADLINNIKTEQQKQETPKAESKPEVEKQEENHTTRNWTIGLSTATALVALGVLGYKGHLGETMQKLMGGAKKSTQNLADNLPSAGTSNAERKAGSAATGAGEKATANTVKKFEEMSVSELNELKKSTDKNTIEYETILKNIFDKSNGKEKISAGEEYIKYLDDISAGNVKLDAKKGFREHTLMDTNSGVIQWEKCDTYAVMSHTYKAEKEYDKALEMMTKANEIFPHNESVIGEIAKLHALRGTPDEGIKIASETLEKMKNQMFTSEQEYLFNGISDCVKAKGYEDLSRAIELLKKGSYHFNELTPEEIKFFTERNIDYKSICGNGGREQTGKMAKWVLEHLDAKKINSVEKATIEAKKRAAAEAEKFVAETKQKLIPEAEDMVKQLTIEWKDEVARLTRIFEKAEKEGFAALKGEKEILADGTYKITLKAKNNDFTYEYLSKDGKKLDEIKVYKDGELHHSTDFTRNDEGVIDILKQEGNSLEGLAFITDRKNPILAEWCNHKLYDENYIGKITNIHIRGSQDGVTKYDVSFSDKEFLGHSFNIEIKA